MKILKKILVTILIVAILILGISIVTFFNNNSRTKTILDDYTTIYVNSEYLDAVSIEGISVIKQDVSCGYAVIEMMANWSGKNITEESLYDTYGKVITSTGKSFNGEMNKQFPEYTTTMHKYMTSSEMLMMIYQSLSDGIPVPFEWAAKVDDSWTLHYSIVIGMDVSNDVITIANPYGYMEEISLEEFVQRTSFEAYEKMPIYLKYGFAFGVFEKNTIFVMEKDI